MPIAFAEAAATTSDPGNTALGFLFIVAIVAFVIHRKRKKNGKVKAKTVKRQNTNAVVTTASSVPAVNSRYFGDDPSLMSIAAFQKYVYDRFVVFDFETTGLDPQNDRIVEIGAVRVENGNITQTYQALVNPGVHIPEEASKKNHITDDMVSDSPSIREVLPSFLRFVGDNVLVAHNAGFDAAFLRAACNTCRRKAPEKFFDSMRLNVYWPDLPNRKLESFLKAAGIKNESPHRALGDAEATAHLVIESFNKIK